METAKNSSWAAEIIKKRKINKIDFSQKMSPVCLIDSAESPNDCYMLAKLLVPGKN